MFHFSIRELLLITVVVGLVLGWQLDHRHQVELRKAHVKMQRISEQQFAHLRSMIEAEGYEVERDGGGWAVRFSRTPMIEAREVVYPKDRSSP